MRRSMMPTLKWTMLLFLLSCITKYTLQEKDKSDYDGICTLLPSELGAEWYKVAQPVPTNFANDPTYEKSYVHMPCAMSTVFDVGVCGCTNLMVYIFNAIGTKTSAESNSAVTIEGSRDIVKQRGPGELWFPVPDTTTTPRPRSGSLLLNTRTGEVRMCPFRASSHGQAWYLVHEPGNTWMPMKCAPGTLFSKRDCTCVHAAVAARDPLKPEDGDIVVLDSVYTNNGNSETLSQSLGISISDVDFRSKQERQGIPSWRRRLNTNSRSLSQKSPQPPIKPDVLVTLDNRGSQSKDTGFSAVDLGLGKDIIADEHRRLLLMLGPVSAPRHHTSPLFIDSILEAVDKINKNEHGLFFEPISGRKGINGKTGYKDLGFQRKESKENRRPVRIAPLNGRGLSSRRNLKQMHDSEESKAHLLNGIGHTDRNGSKITGQTPSSTKVHDPTWSDTVLFEKKECSKRPSPDLGVQYFQMFVKGVGMVPYICHGDMAYSHSHCACVDTKGGTRVDEIRLSNNECSTKPLPELGPGYFEMYIWGVGYVPFSCHGNQMYSHAKCQCVPDRSSKGLTILNTVETVICDRPKDQAKKDISMQGLQEFYHTYWYIWVHLSTVMFVVFCIVFFYHMNTILCIDN